MIEIRKAVITDVHGISRVCGDGWRNAMKGLLPYEHIEAMVKEFYNEERVYEEIQNISREWNGWFVALDNGNVVGAGGGGLVGKDISELFVMYLDPTRRREGIGRKLLAAITQDQINRGSKEQWVSVIKDNFLAIPFYEAMGFEMQCEQPYYKLPEYEQLKYKRSL